MKTEQKETASQEWGLGGGVRRESEGLMDRKEFLMEI